MSDNKARNILIVGVGGQGTLLASKVIGRLALMRGYDVKVSEVHGMSQRGGSVVTYVKYSSGVASPLIEPVGADIMIAFELLEAARWLDYLKPGGMAVVNEQQIDPMPVITGAARYPDGLIGMIREKCAGAVIADALSVAVDCGSTRSVNFVLLGAAAVYLDFPIDDWIASIRETTPPRALDVNLAAFSAGVRIGEMHKSGKNTEGGRP